MIMMDRAARELNCRNCPRAARCEFIVSTIKEGKKACFFG